MATKLTPLKFTRRVPGERTKQADGATQQVPLTLRIDTPIEIDYYQHGGILPYVLRQLLA